MGGELALTGRAGCKRFRAGCRSAIYVLPHIYFDRARTPKELRTACPPLAFLYSRQHHSQTRSVCSVMFSWTFGVAPLVAAPRLLKGRSVGKALPHFRSEPYVFRAGCLPATYTLPRVCFGKARTPTEARRAAPRLGLYIQDNNVRGGVPCVPPLCIVFLDFLSAHVSRRLFASNIHASACMFRQSANANGSAESRSALGSLYSRQQCSRRAAALHRFLGLSLRSAHSRRAST